MQHLLIHLHGFLSANDAPRVTQLRDYIAQQHLDIEVVSPRLPNTPRLAVAALEQMLLQQASQRASIALLGHSLGGYYATYLASRYRIKAALVNPVVRAYEIMCEFYGTVYNPHTDETFEIGEQDIEYLISINLDKIADPDLFMVLLQSGDDIVNPMEAKSYYEGSKVIWEHGGSHDHSNFQSHIGLVLGFLFPTTNK